MYSDDPGAVVSRHGSSFVPVGGGLANVPALITLLDGAVRGNLLRSTDRPLLVPAAIHLSRASYSKMVQNLVWATGYNLVAIPIAMGLGAGADSRRPLGLAVVGGLVVSQFLTLYITPVIYVYLDRFTARVRRSSKAHAPAAPRVAIVHGDYRTGNFLEEGGRITAILDWELVHLGDPHEDLGWASLPMYKGGSPYICRLAEPEWFYRRYGEQVGFEVSMVSVHYYQVFNFLKLAATHMAAMPPFMSVEPRPYRRSPTVVGSNGA